MLENMAAVEVRDCDKRFACVLIDPILTSRSRDPV
jgi:hypothetical protein